MPELRKYNDTEILCVDIDELESIGFSRRYIYKAIQHNRNGKLKSWGHHKEGGKVWIHVSSLPNKRRKMVEDMQPPPMSLEEKVISLLLVNPSDEEYIRNFRNENGKRLPDYARDQYIQQAKYYNLLSEIDKNKAKYIGFKTMYEFASCLIRIALANDINLPRTVKKFAEKKVRYQKIGCRALISAKYGNNNSRKAND